MERLAITAHMIVQNEEQWVWYAIQSVLPFVSHIFIYDAGSTDQTVSIIKTIKSTKIHFEEKGIVTPAQLVQLRNDQIRETKTEWFILVDGDEIWSKEGIDEALGLIENSQPEVMGIVHPALMCVHDLYHRQPDNAGRYELLGKKGHFNIRFYRKKNGYFWKGVYPLEAYTDQKSQQPIQEIKDALVSARVPYWHLSLLKRSSVDTHGKKALEFGVRHNQKLPEVFGQKRPSIIPSPNVGFSFTEKVIAYMRTPLVFLKRRFAQ